MENKYTYEITENGYYILVNGIKYIHQYEPYIPNHNLSYEENAKNQINGMLANDYASDIENKKITIDDVPEELKEKVKKVLASIEEAKKREPATQGDITDIQLALAEVYEMMLGGIE